MQLLIMQFSPTSCHFIPLRSKYSKHPVLKHPQSMFSLNVRDQVSHPYKTTGKTIVFIYLNLHISRQQTGRQKILNCMVASIRRI
jgi:putative component of membrane protein insertase Oxa1/YidC/SpoIIIJ protein YidD